MSEEGHELTADEARAALVRDQRQRASAAMQEIRAVLAKYKVDLKWFETRVNGEPVEAGFKVVAVN